MRTLTVMFLFMLGSAFAQIQPGPQLDIPQSSLCKKTCVNGTLNLYFMSHSSLSGKRDCPTAKASTSMSCGTYQCNQQGNECLTACSNNSQCAAGFTCNTQVQKCVALSYQCSSNTTVMGTDGSNFDCYPYVCSAGKCVERCTITTQCAPGNVCNTETHSCVIP